MEQALVFASIVLGVAVAFELGNLNTILRSDRVKWHWAQPLFALFVLLSIISYWWMAAAKAEGPITLGEFLPIMFQLTMLVLMAAVSLPDKVEGDGIDLAAYYQSNRKYQWTLVALYFWSIHLSYVSSVLKRDPNWTQFLVQVGPDTIAGLVVMGMIFASRWRWVALGMAILALGPAIWVGRTIG